MKTFLRCSYLHEMFARHLVHLCKTARSTSKSPGGKIQNENTIPEHPINKQIKVIFYTYHDKTYNHAFHVNTTVG